MLRIAWNLTEIETTFVITDDASGVAIKCYGSDSHSNAINSTSTPALTKRHWLKTEENETRTGMVAQTETKTNQSTPTLSICLNTLA